MMAEVQCDVMRTHFQPLDKKHDILSLLMPNHYDEPDKSAHVPLTSAC